MKKLGILFVLIFLVSIFPMQRLDAQTDAQIKAEWTYFYRKYFNCEVNLSEVKIPAYKPGFDRVLIITSNLSYKKFFL